MKIRTILVIFLFYIICPLRVFSCIYNVRDIGFVDMAPNPYHLFCFIQDNTQERIVTTLKKISYTTFLESNISVEIINVDQKKNHPAIEYFHFWEIKSFPAAILISPVGKSLVLPISIPNNTFNETVRSSFHSVISSPIREEILNHIVKSYCIILLIEGKDEAENKRAYEIAASTTRKITKIMSQLPKRIEEPPYKIVIPQELIPKERLLLWSLGLDGNKINKPCVAVIYGRGRRIGPLLKGEKITRNRLFKILSIIGLSCDCGLDKRWMMGPLLPLRWDEKIQSDVVKFLGFDAESPMVKIEMSSIMSLDFFKQTEDEGIKRNLGDALDEYREEVLEFEDEQKVTRVSPAKFREFISLDSAGSKSRLNLKTMLYIMGIIVLMILAGGSFILIRARRKLS